MKILIYGLNYAPEPTGTGKYTGEMASWLAKRGHQVEVIAAFPHYPAWEVDENYKDKGFHVEVIDGVKVYRAPLYVPNAKNVTAKNRIKMELSYSLNTLKYWVPILFKKNTYDVIIAVSPPMQVGLLPHIYNIFRKVPWIFHIQDLQVDAAVRLNMLKEGKFVKLLFNIESYLLKKASVVSTITEAMQRRIIDKGIKEEKTWLFPNWADINYVKPLCKKNNPYREELGIADDEVVFMYSGNMGEKQGLDLILQAAEILKEDRKIKFIMAGEGATKSRLQKIKDEKNLSNVLFLPLQPYERLPEFLAAADVHLVVQKREAADLVMPSKLTNIVAAGKPSIATADSGTALYEVLVNHKAGEVVPPGDLVAFTEKIKLLKEDKQKRELMGKNARVYAEKYLNKDNILREFEQKLINLIQNYG
ncbi:WcaI family glycosyltransferase [Geobacillus thermodenitrificans]|uniref:WcaI family glycosyltransferase n=1 Tax=Geobacillus thermodenitrificans TaxID=33940 RepID=UPI002E20BE08|nr:WcaI family glycosyltransferase [Geobacillus thermodenitrificans]MED3906940.1 WcaI family glycosyltransferase [Geobacillus thermodenitrificans]